MYKYICAWNCDANSVYGSGHLWHHLNPRKHARRAALSIILRASIFQVRADDGIMLMVCFERGGVLLDANNSTRLPDCELWGGG
jgi:hypothetical protein